MARGKLKSNSSKTMKFSIRHRSWEERKIGRQEAERPKGYNLNSNIDCKHSPLEHCFVTHKVGDSSSSLKDMVS